MKSVLIVDKDTIILNKFNQLFQIHGAFFNVLMAYNGRQAINILKDTPVDIVITGLKMSEMDGFELMVYMKKEFPKIKIVIMTDKRSPVVRAKLTSATDSENSNALEDISVLTERVFFDLTDKYGGQVRGISLVSFLQMLELERTTCTLKIISKDRKGHIYMKAGELIAAESGELKGKEAAIEILCWDKPLIGINYRFIKKTKEINLPLMNVLLESQELKDSMKISHKSKRLHTRFECLIAVDFDLSDWSYKSFVRDISLGGAYIETDQPISVGQEIFITINTNTPKACCRISGKVSRRDERGIGIQFQDLSLYQQNVIKSITKGKKELD